MTASASSDPSSRVSSPVAASRSGPAWRSGHGRPPPRSRPPAGSAWRQPEGDGRDADVGGVGASRSPVRNTFTATASEASSAGRLSVGRAIRFQSESIAFSRLPVRPQPEAKVCSSSAGSDGSSLREPRCGAGRRQALARSAAARSGAGSTARWSGGGGRCREIDAAGRPSRRTGTRQPPLERQQVVDADPAQEAEVRGAAAKRDVLAVVELEAVALERERRAAEARARLVEDDLGAAVGALERRREPGEPAAHHGAPSCAGPGEAAGEDEALLPGPKREPAAGGRATARRRFARAAGGTYRPSRGRRRRCGGRSAARGRAPSASRPRPRSASKAITSSIGPSNLPPTASHPKRSRSSRGR